MNTSTKLTENLAECGNKSKPLLCNGYRQGNLFKIENDIHFHNVLEIQNGSLSFDDFYGDAEDSEYEAVNILEVEPIKITTSWLEMLGFKFVVRNMWELKVDFYTKLQFYNNQDDYITLHIKNYKDMKFESETYTYLKHIKHIHEIQNLFHSLTGRELTVA